VKRVLEVGKKAEDERGDRLRRPKDISKVAVI
jgi:hypothetical protein